jgi:hypothetical protein
MWRTALALSLFLTLVLGGVAEAKCLTCIQSVRIDTGDSGMTLVFGIQGLAGKALPESGTAVLMSFNGNRSKCINVPVLKTDVTGGLATYRGSLPAWYGSGYAVSSYSGRVDFGGDIFEFTVPTDGKPGTVQLVTAATAGQVASATTVPTAAPTTIVAATTAPAAQPVATAEPQVAGSGVVPSPFQQPMTWLALIAILATLGGAYADRKRALARATAS